MEGITLRIRKHTRTRISRKSRVYSVSGPFEEILNVKPVDSTAPSWTRSTLSHDPVIRWTKTKENVYSDSVLCLVKLSDLSEANRRWEGQVTYFQVSASYEELLGIDGEPIEFGWNIFPGLTSLQIPQRIQNDLQQRNIEPENLRANYLHVNVQRHRKDKKSKRKELYFKFRKCQDVREKILAGTLEVPRP